MEHIIGGYAKNFQLIIENAIDYFEKTYLKSFYHETINYQDYFISVIREKSNKLKNNLILLEKDVIFKSPYYNQIPDKLLKDIHDLNYDNEIRELNNDLIFIKFNRDKGIKVYVDKFARDKIYYTLTSPLLFSTSYKFLISIINKKKINYNAIIRFLNSGVNLREETFFLNIKRLDFGEYLKCNEKRFIVNKYWTLNKDFFDTSNHSIDDIQYWIDYIYDILKETFNFQIDGSIISLMSGGLDSTIMTAILLKKFDLPIKALTFEVSGYSEIDVEKAQEVSEYLNLPHSIKNQKINDPNFLKRAYTNIFNIIEEPIGGSAFISRYFTYNEARNIGNSNIFVGDGADQIFAYKGKFILKNFKYINYMYRFPLKVRRILNIILHNAHNLSLGFVNHSNNKDLIDAIDVIMKSDFLRSKNQFQSLYCAYQFNNLDNFYEMFNYKIELDEYMSPLLRNHSYYPFNDYNRIGFNTVIFCVNSDNLLNKALVNYHNLKLFTPFISDIPIKKILPISPQLKMVSPQSKWILMEMARKKKILPESYFKKKIKTKYGLYQHFLEKKSFETTLSYIFDIINSIQEFFKFPSKHFIKYFKNVSLENINKHTSEYMKFNIWFGFLGWLNSIKSLNL